MLKFSKMLIKEDALDSLRLAIPFASRKLAVEIVTRKTAGDSNNETQSGINLPQR